MTRNLIHLFYIGLLQLATGTLAAQNMNTPYSIYGIGDMDFRPYNRTSGMGGTGLALRSSYFFIDNNPAAAAGLTRSVYLVDAAVTGKTVKYSGDAIDATNSSNKDFWIKRLSLSVKLNNSWASAIGISQFSNINYKFYGNKTVEGSTGNYLTLYEGDGGLNEYHWTNAFAIGKRLSLGLRSSIIAGAINQTETVGDGTLELPIETKVQDYMGKARFQLGAIYNQPFGKHWDVSFGGKYIPKVRLVSERTLTVTEGSTILVEDAFVKNDRFYLPETFGLGIAIRKNNKTTFAADYTHEDWSSLRIKEQGWQLVNSDRFSAGVEFSKTATMWNQQVEKRFFQVGGFINNSYLQVRNQPVREYGITAGIGGTLGRGLLYTVAIEAGQRGTTQQKLIRENYGQLTLTLSYRDILMSKGRRYD